MWFECLIMQQLTDAFSACVYSFVRMDFNIIADYIQTVDRIVPHHKKNCSQINEIRLNYRHTHAHQPISQFGCFFVRLKSHRIRLNQFETVYITFACKQYGTLTNDNIYAQLDLGEPYGSTMIR